MNIIEQIKNDVRNIYAGGGGSHDWDHVMRVCNLCVYIGSKEKADIEVLELAAVLHDIGRSRQDVSEGRRCHARLGAEMARELLVKHYVKKDTADNVVHCVESHRYRGRRKPLSKEARILYDADKLDSIGAIGIGRAFLFAGQIGAKLHNSMGDNIRKTKPYTKEDTAYREFTVKLSKIKDKMLTDEGKRLAEDRHIYMVNFFDRLQKEINSEL